jgi:hypothetical protein
LSGGTHAGADEGGKEVGGNGEAGAFGDVVDRGDDLDASSWTGEAGEEVGEGFSGAFDARRNDARGNDSCLEKAKVIFGKIEDVGERGDFCAGSEIDASESKDGLIDDTEVGFDRRFRFVIAAMNGEIH